MRNCHHCGNQNYIKNGSYKGVQRYVCKSCGRSFSSNGLRIPLETKRQALEMYVNRVGIRKIARFVQVSPTSVLNWIKKARVSQLPKGAASFHAQVDSIEMDDIYTFVQKKSQRVAVWTADSPQEPCVIAFVIGKGLAAAQKLYALVKEQQPRMKTIYTDANSCYQVAFAQ